MIERCDRCGATRPPTFHRWLWVLFREYRMTPDGKRAYTGRVICAECLQDDDRRGLLS